MIYRFAQFEFDTDKQLLTRNGKIISLNEKPAQLLTLLIESPNNVFSKDVILDAVWSGRVTSDQVVFQNISHLRAMFGQDAIKTYVKKGYQWQLPLTVCEPETLNQGQQQESPRKQIPEQDMPSSQKSVEVKSVSRPIARPAILITIAGVIFCLFLVFLINLLSSKEVTEPVNSAEPLLTIKHKNEVQALFDTPFTTWRARAKQDEQRLLAKRLYSIEDAHILRFHLQGKERGWHGFIFGKDTTSQHEQVAYLNKLLTETDFFTASSEHVALAQLTLLHSRYPDNVLITRELIEQHYIARNYERALALINSQINSATTRFDIALMHYLKAKVLLRTEQWHEAQLSIDASLNIFTELKFNYLLSEVKVKEAWFQIHMNNHENGMKAINDAISYARAANAPLLEVKAHLVQATFAAKFNQTALMRNELNLSEQLLSLHNLSAEHQVALLNIHAATADSESARMAFYKQILEIDFSPTYRERFYYAAKQLREHYIHTREWPLASATIHPWQRRSFKSLSMAYIALAQEQWEQANRALLQTFRDGQIDYQVSDALDAALLMIQYQSNGWATSNVDGYYSYIRNAATRDWIERNHEKINKIEGLKDLTR